MATIIYTGERSKCYQANYLECPVCGDKFESEDGVYVRSATLDDDLSVCNKHKEFSAEDEVKIQESLQRAIADKRGRVHKGATMLKRSEILEKANFTITKDW
jgi:hypothetical protein